jgi:multiple antibiotic resistance protein
MEFSIELAGYVLAVVLAIVPIANPFSTAPIFVALTAHANTRERHKTATQACLYMAVLLIVVLLIGTYILQFFGISMKSLRLAGGLVIAYTGFRMLYPPEPSGAQPAEVPDRSSQNIAFTPLALPMLSGPGAISVVMAMATKVSELKEFSQRIAGYVVVSVGIILSAAICWLVLWSSGSVVRFLGESGIDATTKLMGFLLICIGTQFVISGWAMT